MLIIGAKGFAKEVLEVFAQKDEIDKIVFFDDLDLDGPTLLYNKFTILKNINQAKKYFEKIDNRFIIGIGNPILRKTLCDKFESLGGKLSSIISPKSIIGSFDVEIGLGSNILPGAIISNSSSIGKACIVYYNCNITHDVKVGDFVEMSPNVTLLGYCKIGDYSHIGANATILPNVEIGKNVIVGAGAVVTKNIPNNCVVVGVPAKIIKKLRPLNF